MQDFSPDVTKQYHVILRRTVNENAYCGRIVKECIFQCNNVEEAVQYAQKTHCSLDMIEVQVRDGSKEGNILYSTGSGGLLVFPCEHGGDQCLRKKEDEVDDDISEDMEGWLAQRIRGRTSHDAPEMEYPMILPRRITLALTDPTAFFLPRYEERAELKHASFVCWEWPDQYTCERTVVPYSNMSYPSKGIVNLLVSLGISPDGIFFNGSSAYVEEHVLPDTCYWKVPCTT